MRFHFSTKVWIWDGQSPWYFVTVPEEESAKIRKAYRAQHRGWGSIPVQVELGKSKWKTSIFWEKKGTYLLPIKKEVRIREDITNGSNVDVKITIDRLK